jgi:hypothetical protein
MTRGALVRTPSDRHGMIESFDAHSNTVELSFFDGHPNESFSILKLRAGNDVSQKQAVGHVTKAFPKILDVEPLSEADTARVKIDPWRLLGG